MINYRNLLPFFIILASLYIPFSNSGLAQPFAENEESLTGSVSKASTNIDIDSRELPPDEVEKGESFVFEVVAINDGEETKYGGIAFSFPELDQPGDENAVEIVSSGDDPDEKYEVGETIYDREGNEISAEYLLVQLEGGWEANEKKRLRVRVHPSQGRSFSTGNFRVNWRATASTDSEDRTFPPSEKTNYEDQQGWPVKQPSTDVRKPLAAIDFRIENIDAEWASNTVPGDNGEVNLFDESGSQIGDTKSTELVDEETGAGEVTFEELPPTEDYSAEVYHDPDDTPFGSREYWASVSGIDVQSGETRDVTIERSKPFLSLLRAVQDGEEVTGGSVTAGEEVTIQVQIHNPSDGRAADVRPRVALEDERGEEVFDETGDYERVVEGYKSTLYSFTWTPREAGEYYRGYEVQINEGGDQVTDSAPFETKFVTVEEPPSAAIDLRVQNVDAEGASNTVPGDNGEVNLFDENGNQIGDTEPTDAVEDGTGAGEVTFTDLDPSKSYEAQVYHDNEDSPLSITEYWGEKTGISVSSGETTEADFTRYQPYFENLQVFNGEGEKVTKGTVEAGTPLTLKLTVKNDGSAQEVRPRLVLDRDKQKSFDYDRTRPKEVITKGQTKTFAFDWTPEEPGDVYRTYVINGVVPDGKGGSTSDPTGSGGWGSGPLISITGQVKEIVISEIGVNGEAFNPGSDDIPTLSPGDNIRVKGHLEDGEGNRAHTDQFGAEDELAMQSIPEDVKENGDFSYKTEVVPSALTGKRSLFFQAKGGEVVKAISFGINSQSNVLEVGKAKKVARKTLEEKYGVQVSEIKSEYENGEKIYKEEVNFTANTFNISSESDVDRRNYKAVLRAFNTKATNPWSRRPDDGAGIYQAALEVQEEAAESELEETVKGVGARAWDIANNPRNWMLFGATVGSCALTIKSAGAASPLCVASAAKLKTSVAVDATRSVVNEAMYQSGVDKETRELTNTATGLVASGYTLSTSTDPIELISEDVDLTFEGVRHARKLVRYLRFESAINDSDPSTTNFEDFEFECVEKSVGGGCRDMKIGATYKGDRHFFRVNALNNDGPKPKPSIIGKIEAPEKVSTGEEFTVQAQIENQGGLAKYGSVSTSFPGYDSAGDESLVEAGGDISTGDEPGYVEVPAGDELFTKEGDKKGAEYLLAEYADDAWEPGEVNTLDLVVEAPSSPGTFMLLVRSSLTTTDKTYTVPGEDSDAETATDQQGYRVFKVPVEVEGDGNPSEVQISGTVKYPRAQRDGDPVEGAEVTVSSTEGGESVKAQTDADGTYDLNVSDGTTYEVTVTDGPGGAQGIDISDALDVQRYFLGQQEFSDLQQSVADVDATGTADISDALDIQRYWLGQISGFDAGTRYSTRKEVSMSGENKTADLRLAAFGDANLSGGFGGGEGSATASTSASGTFETEVSTTGPVATGHRVTSSASGSVLEIPVRVDRRARLGAYQLSFDYPTEKVQFRTAKAPNSSIQTYSKDGTVRLSWFDRSGGEEPISIGQGEVLVTLVFEVGEVEKGDTFRLSSKQGKLFGQSGKALSGAKLKVPGVQFEGAPEGFALRGNAPNPFQGRTTIRVDMPEKGRVTIKVYDTLGQQVKTVRREVGMGRGQQIKVDGAGLGSGVYFYQLQARFGKEKVHKTGRITVMR